MRTAEWSIFVFETKNEQQGPLSRPTTYFNLIELAGDSGPYQVLLVVLFGLTWFSAAVILLSTAFLFRLRDFDCYAHGLVLTSQQCSEYVCQLP